MTGITTTETAEFLTDRWGSALADDGFSDSKPITETERGVIEKLIPSMYDEYCFIVRKGDKYGILIEAEYDDGLRPTDEDARQLVDAAIRYPFAEFWFTQGDHTFGGRVAVRAFVPTEHCDANTVADIAEQMPLVNT